MDTKNLARIVQLRIDACCVAANTPGADYFDASTSLIIAARELLASIAAPVTTSTPASIEEMIRFCPDCGLLGEIPEGYQACCPDSSHARVVPKRFAELCAETFKLCVSQPFESSAAQPDARSVCIEWANANGYTKYHESMVAAWEEATRRATQQATKGDERAALDTPTYCQSCGNYVAIEADHEEWCSYLGWKRRALEAEELNRKFMASINGPTHMGEPVVNTPSPVAGSAGQAPGEWVGYYWIGSDNRQKFCGSYDTIDVETANRAQKVYIAAPTAPSLTTDAGAVITDAKILGEFEKRFISVPMRDGLGTPTFDGVRVIEGVRALLAAHPTEQRMSDAAHDVLAERARQINEEGFTSDRDDKYHPGELATAAGCYGIWGWGDSGAHSTPGDEPNPWPWPRKWWKPSTLRRHCVKGAALYLAEIERIDRAARKAEIERSGGGE